jgi:hypothetical protein
MAERRGRRASGNYKQKTHVFSTRITADLREALGVAANNKGHSLSQEVEHRLRRSFDEDIGIIERFGNRRNYSVLRLISSYMDAIYNPIDLQASWLDDPYVFAQLVKAVSVMLAQLRPPGDPAPPAGSTMALAPDTFQGDVAAAYWLGMVKAAEPDMLPVGGNNKETNLAALIRSDLGQIAERIDIPTNYLEDKFREWTESVVPRNEGEDDEAYRRRAPPTVLSIRWQHWVATNVPRIEGESDEAHGQRVTIALQGSYPEMGWTLKGRGSK